MLEITPNLRIPLSEMQFTYVRSSGPGGQNVNKVSSKAVLRWNPSAGGLLSETVLERLATLYPAHWTKEGEILITSQKTRDALKNHDDCLEKLRKMILHASEVPKPRIPTRPTRGSILRKRNDKIKQSEKKQRRKQMGDDD